MIRAAFTLIVVLALAGTSYAQCNAGVSNSQVQVQATANQALALQQAAILQAGAVSQRSTTIQRTRTVSPVLGLGAVAAPTCASCQQQPQLAAQPAANRPQLILTSGAKAPPGKYVIVSPRPAGPQLAAR